MPRRDLVATIEPLGGDDLVALAQCHALHVPAMLETLFSSGRFHKDPAHGLGGGAHKMSPAVP